MMIIFSVVIAVAVLGEFSSGFLPDLVISVPALLGTAISILLSFRVSQSYDRWWEARKVWGLIVNDARTFALQVTTFLPDGNDALVKKMAYRQISWCFMLGRSLRRQDPLANAERHLSKEDIDAIKDHMNKPLALLQLNTKVLKELRESGTLQMYERIQMDSTLVRLVASMGAAERIKNTVFPVTYTMFLKYFIYIFLISLAISLKNVAVVYEIPLLMIVAAAFFLLEGSANQLQDPFENMPTDTSMTAIAETIETNIRQILGEENVPSPQSSDSYYLM
jgi:putative membrane protein